jgi:DivIVA domain-containing protein
VTPSGGSATPPDTSGQSSGVPPFKVVFRGYDRRQVDEHLSRLQRRYNALRRGLDSAHSQAGPAPPGMSSARSRPRPDGAPPRGDSPDVVGTFIARCRPSSKPRRRRPTRSGERPRPRRGPRRSARRPRVRPPVRPRNRSARRSRSWSANATPHWRTSHGYAASSRRSDNPVRSRAITPPIQQAVPRLSKSARTCLTPPVRPPCLGHSHFLDSQPERATTRLKCP